jgi:MerR family transcriptional regulator, light-induced transcriptional regulator
LLIAAVEQGHSIGRLAGLGDEALRQLASPVVPKIDPTVRPPLDPTVLTAGLSAALQNYDAAGIDQEIGRLSAVLPPLELLRDVLMPVLVQVGDDWHKSRAGIAQEHLMSSAIRNILGAFLRLHTRRDVPARLLFATPSGDRHEIGTLGAAMLAANSGLGVTYLGPDLPAGEIVQGVEAAGAQVLVLGLTTALAEKGTERELGAIVRDLPREIELWAGGRGTERHASLIRRRGLIFDDYGAYQQELVRIGGRA